MSIFFFLKKYPAHYSSGVFILPKKKNNYHHLIVKNLAKLPDGNHIKQRSITTIKTINEKMLGYQLKGDYSKNVPIEGLVMIQPLVKRNVKAEMLGIFSAHSLQKLITTKLKKPQPKFILMEEALLSRYDLILIRKLLSHTPKWEEVRVHKTTGQVILTTRKWQVLLDLLNREQH
ncbi:MAG: hypothetical protein ACK4GR_04330 [bacterium]